jgi:hypothetical protein
LGDFCGEFPVLSPDQKLLKWRGFIVIAIAKAG